MFVDLHCQGRTASDSETRDLTRELPSHRQYMKPQGQSLLRILDWGDQQLDASNLCVQLVMGVHPEYSRSNCPRRAGAGLGLRILLVVSGIGAKVGNNNKEKRLLN